MSKDSPYADIAERIRWHRAYEKKNQHEYARVAGVSRSQVSNWELGTKNVSVEAALKLRDTYGLSLDFIFAGSADMLPPNMRTAWLSKP